MKPAVSILLLITLLAEASGAQAASTGAVGSNPMLPPPSPITPVPQTNPGLLAPNTFGAQSLGALPGNSRIAHVQSVWRIAISQQSGD